MGSVSYDFLANSILFDQKSIDNNFNDLSDDQLQLILQEYRKHSLNNYNVSIEEITKNKSSLKVFSEIEKMPFELLKQSALYFDQFVIYDPLFKITHEKSKASKAFAKFLGFDPPESIDREQLSQIANHLKMITPMVAGDFVKIIPLSYHLEPPKEIPITLPVNYYADSLPPEIISYFRERVKVTSTIETENGWDFLDHLDYTPGLFINFKGLHTNGGYTYNYAYPEIAKIDDKYITRLEIAKYPINKEEWNIWVFQCINSAAKSAYNKINLELMVANDLNATFLTDKDFIANIITENLNAKETVETASASQFLNMELPFMDRIDISKLMEIRQFEAETFTNFRIELERQCKELRLVSDPYEIKLRQENIIHDLGTVQVNKLNKKLTSLKNKGLLEASILFASLSGSVQTGGWSILTAAYAALSGIKSYRDYKDSIRENPAYFLWKVLK
ncbi:MAG TPA: hypothetical protein VFE53_10565 [Mucilaginibacter sp.]|jgi:hypothetical protein|nr:hypothetical protein [Mucilaginibacter sp.]